MAGFLIYWSRGVLGRELLYFVDGKIIDFSYLLQRILIASKHTLSGF